MRRLFLALACAAAVSRAPAQTPPDTAAHGARVRTEYDDATDSTTRSVSAYVVVDTSLAPPDTLAVELVRRWKGRGTVAPDAPVELGLGHTRVEGMPAGKSLLGGTIDRSAVVFLLDGTRRIRLERAEYVSSAGARITFETARYRISPADLRRIADCQTLRVQVGGRELWIDPGWRRVVAELLADTGAPGA